MTRHPLYDHFLKRDEKKKEGLEPISKEHLVETPASFTAFDQVGCLILAGGQGSRLGFQGPKGCAVLRAYGDKTLFQIHFEKIAAKRKDLSVVVMTSPLNHQETVEYLEKHAFFGLTDVSFITQEMTPLCSDEGMALELAPNGNGEALKLLEESGCFKDKKFVQVVPIDNPLADPFDEELLGANQGAELAIRAVKLEDKGEKLGALGEKQGRLYVHEYFEIERAIGWGNTGLFSCTMDFVKRAVKKELAWHIARKQDLQNRVWVWKFEKFIIDLFPLADSFKVIVSQRERCFQPIKELADLTGFMTKKG